MDTLPAPDSSNDTPARPLSADEPIPLGLIGRPHGLGGELRVKLLRITPDDIDRLETDRLLLLERRSEPREVTIESWRFHKDLWLVRLAEFPDRTAVEALNGATLALRREDLWRLGPDEFFESDLQGFTGVDAETGEPLGVLARVIDGAAQDLFEFQRPDGVTFLTPAVHEIVREIDTAQKQIRLALPPGLIELNEEPGERS